MEIPAELEAKIDEAITHYPVFKRSATLPLLHLFQEHFGFITDEAIDWIAKKLELSPINVLELVTFYPMFRREPAGKHHIRVCRTLSCAMAGGYELLDTFCKHAKIDRSHNGHGHILKSEDEKYSIEFVECLASCGFGPVCMINDDFYEAVAQEEVPELLEKYQ
jgi:NADH-quinone oxidoreductase subunit E